MSRPMLFKVRLHIDKIKMCFHVKQNISYYQIQMEKELDLEALLCRCCENWQSRKILQEISTINESL